MKDMPYNGNLPPGCSSSDTEIPEPDRKEEIEAQKADDYMDDV